MRLSLVPPLMDGEPLHGFVSRVARRNGVDMPTLCSELGLSVRGVVSGDGDAVRRLSDLTGVPEATLSRRAFRPCGGTWLHGDVVLHRQGVRRIDLAICPHCLRDDVRGSAAPRDVAAHVRAAWLVKAVRTCPVHGVALLEVPDKGPTLFGDRYHDLAARIAPMLDRIDRLADAARRDAATRLEGWIVVSVDGRERPATCFLDTMPLFAAIRTCEMVGVAALFGPRTTLRSLDDGAWRAAGEVGFDVAALGPEAIDSCLRGLMRDHGVASRNLGPAKAFGILYRWLRSGESGPAYEPLRAVLRDVIMDTIPLAAGTDVLGVTLCKRRLHSLRSACGESGQGLKGMRRELRADGVLPVVDGVGPGHLVTITAEQADAAREDAADSVSRKVAASIVGATAADVRRLASAGLLNVVVSGSGSPLANSRFSRRDLTAFVGRLSASVTGVEPAGAGACDIPTAASRSRRGLAAITALVLDGGLRSVARADGVHGFRSMRVDADEISGLDEYDRSSRRSVDEVARELRVTRVTALEFVRDGHLAATRTRSPLSRRELLLVDASDLEAFAATFVSLSSLANRRGISPGELKARLDGAGVIPAFPGDRTHSVVYRTADLDPSPMGGSPDPRSGAGPLGATPGVRPALPGHGGIDGASKHGPPGPPSDRACP